ncbi:hypothetical protein AB0K51_26550 [Kitasatospora sp. NPDC049285]|uniref:hypothetical protein n=1 Tax=Kitasatospora sp. NPDC049285 TaxID=3157096 RepID=UPI003444CA11
MTDDQRQAEELTVRMAEYVASAERSAPPSSVDPLRAVRRGRSAVRQRRWTVLGAVAAVVVASGSFAVLHRGSATGSAPIGPVAPNSTHSSPTAPFTALPDPTPTGPAAAVPTIGRAALTVQARFGWLPDAVAEVEFSATRVGVQTTASTGPGHSTQHYSLQVFPAGVNPDEAPTFADGSHGVRVAAPQVNGREAYWLQKDRPDGWPRATDVLRFRLADGRWAELDTEGLEDADRQAVPLRIAAGVLVGAYAVPMPASMASLPPSAVLVAASITAPRNGGGWWTASLGFQEQGSHYVSVYVTPDGPNPGAGSPSTDPSAGSHPQACSSGGGLKWCAMALEPPDGKAGDPNAWLPRVVGHGADPNAWTTEVLP